MHEGQKIFICGHQLTYAITQMKLKFEPCLNDGKSLFRQYFVHVSSKAFLDNVVVRLLKYRYVGKNGIKWEKIF